MNGVLVGLLVYVAVQFMIGAWVSRWIKTETDYINAGRSLGMTMAAFSVFATWFGAEAIVGTASQVYENGLAGAETDPFGYAVALMAAGLFVAAALWRRGLTTFADFFRERYSPGVEKLVVLVLLPGSIFWAAAQVRAFGQVVSSVSDIHVPIAITAAAIVVVAYTVLGGLYADAATDLIQGVAIIAGLIAIAAIAAASSGGLGASLAAVPPERFNAYVVGDERSLLQILEGFAVPICGTIVAVELISRILGCRSATVARNATVAGGVLYLIVGMIPVYLGLVGPSFVAGLSGAEAEQIVPALAQKLLPGLLFILFAGALISAILSTVDSVLLAAASQVSHNIAMRLVADPTPRLRLLSARLAVVALAILAYGLALYAESIRDLVEVASAAGSTGVFVSLVFGLNSRFGGEASAYGAIVIGGAVWLFGYVTEATSAPFLLSLGVAAVVYVALALLRPAPAEFAKT